VGTDEEARYYVSEDERLLERTGNDREHSGSYQDKGEVPDQVYFFRHVSYSLNAVASRFMALRSCGTSRT